MDAKIKTLREVDVPCTFGLAVTLWVEQKKEETVKGYRSPLIKYRVRERERKIKIDK